jgi:amidophosphoribosyltransferase
MEHIYLALPSTIFGDRLVKTERRHMGEMLHGEWAIDCHDLDEWIVCGVPKTGLSAAQGFAEASGMEYRDVFVKNDYVDRTFIEPEQDQRENSVRKKLQAMSREILGKKVVVVEDSIVRSTTIRNIVRILRDAGAVEVHVCISSPPYKYICPLGIDTQHVEDLIASRMSVSEIGVEIGADSLTYLSLDGLIKAIDNPSANFCTGCFSGNYPLEIK